jgi:DNA polymerase III epsilon subunit family exonuclease
MVPRERKRREGTNGRQAAFEGMDSFLELEEPVPPQPGIPLLSEVTFCCFDAETTGLSAFSRLVEIGAVRFRLEGEPEEFSTLVNPGRPIEEDAVLVHGIDDDMVSGAPDAHEALSSFFGFMQGCVPVAHNASFDVGVMAVEASRAGLPLPEETVLDSIGLARNCLPGLANYRLSTLAEALGIGNSLLHRSLADARVVARIVEEAALRVGDWRIWPLSHFADMTTSVRFRDFSLGAAGAPRGLALLQEAAEAGLAVSIVYEGGSKGTQPRLVTPRGLQARRGVVYLEALCHIDGVIKNFRLDRIRAIEPL